jgi:hypothetical protein
VAGPEEDITAHEDDAEETPASLRSRVLGIAVTVLVVSVLVFGYMHVTLQNVPGGAPAPKGHYPGPCWACHMVTGAGS